MEHDQHSSREPGGRRDAVDPASNENPDLSRMLEGVPEPALTEGEAEGAVSEPTAAEPSSASTDPAAGEDMIMSRLPRTRPQRDTGRRSRAAGTGSAAARARAPKRTAPRKASQARSAPRTGKQSQRGGERAPSPPARARRATRPPAPPAPPRTPSVQRTRGDGAASLPRLAVDGAMEAAKLPLKVSGRLTLRALDAVARSLRGR